MQPLFNIQSQRVIARAKQLAAEGGSGIAGEAHLFLSLLEVTDEADALISPLLALSGVSREEARLYAQSAVEIVAPSAGETRLSHGARKIIYNAAFHAQFGYDRTPRIEPHHLLIACVAYRGSHAYLGDLAFWNSTVPLGEVLASLGFNTAQLRSYVRGLKAEQNSSERFTGRAEKALETAQAAMRASFCGRISATHLLLGLLSDDLNIASETLQKAGCDLEELQQRARTSIRSDGQIATHEKRFSPGAKRALERAAAGAKAAGHKHIDCGHLLLGLLPARPTPGEKWRARGRELDNVDGLWTAEEVAVLGPLLAWIPVAAPPLQKAGPNPKQAAPVIWWIFFFSFITGFIWGAALNERVWEPLLALTVNAIALGVPLVTGIGNCVGYFFDVPPRFRSVCRSTFAGWIIGIVLGAILLVHF